MDGGWAGAEKSGDDSRGYVLMSAALGFSDGGAWFVGQGGWNRLLERTRDKLKERNLDHLSGEIYDYGVDFDLHPDETRVPLVQALLDAALELQAELGLDEGWNVSERGPYFGELVERLERELSA
jgi:hypothetical protein